MAAIIDKHTAERMNNNQRQHNSAHRIDLAERLWSVSLQYILRDVARAQWEYQRSCRYDERTNHICDNQSQIWFIVRKEFLASRIHDFPLKQKRQPGAQ